jgi:Caspase domain
MLSNNCRFSYHARLFFIITALVFFCGVPNLLRAQPTQRVALVIGNANYAHHDRLRNPVNDAQLMATTLRTSGFDRVDVVNEADQIRMLTAISEFRARASNAGLAVIYFSGHGMKHSGERQNYLLPIDMPSVASNASLNPDIILQSKAVSEGSLLDAMSGARFQLLILDACRDNAQGTKSGDKGLARRAGVGAGRMIAYATEEGKTAKDGVGANSPYAQSLAKHFANPRLSIVQALDEAAVEVRNNTNQFQQPMKSGDLAWNVQLNLASLAIEPSNAGPLTTNQSTDPEAVAWNTAKAANVSSAYKDYLQRFPAGRNAASARVALASLETVSAPEQKQITVPPRIKELGENKVSLIGNFSFQGPLGRYDKTLLSFNPAGDHIAVLGVANGPAALSPLELRSIAELGKAKKRITGERLFWSDSLSLMGDNDTAQIGTSTYAKLEQTSFAKGNFASLDKRIDPQVGSNGQLAVLDPSQSFYVSSAPCKTKPEFTATDVPKTGLLTRAGVWSTATGACIFSANLMVDDINHGIKWIVTNHKAEKIAYSYKYGSFDLFIQPTKIRSTSDVVRISRSLAPKDSNNRGYFENASMSRSGNWLATWSRFSAGENAEHGPALFELTGAPKKFQLADIGGQIDGMEFLRNELLLTVSRALKSSSSASPALTAITIHQLPNSNAFIKFQIENAPRLHGSAISQDGSRFALAFEHEANNTVVEVFIFQLK